MVSSKRSIVMSVVLACLLALVAGPAAALGLGQIRVISQVNEPLLAEIPIISNDPSELEQLQARLASPETFRRIGLEPPEGVVADLRFAVALDAQGRPVVRVTSIEPIRQPLLTFLIEVDWGQGRLVREYSALIDAPNAAAAPVQPAIQAATAAPDNRITRLPQEPVAQMEPLPQEVAVPTSPTTATTATPATPAAPAWQYSGRVVTASNSPSGDYSVNRGDTLSQIAASLRLDGNYNLDQTMLALLRSNPEAFIDGNINLVKAGAVLRMPEQAELARLDRAEAAAVVRAQVRSWQQARQPQPQPVRADVSVANNDTPNPNAPDGNAGNTDVRLEIVPPSGGDTPGTQSGLSAGGEGEMLRTQALQEELASRDAEVGELRARVAELENLQQKQHKLIELKDSKLAAVEQSLAQVRADAGQTVAVTDAASESGSLANIAPWLIGGGIVLLLAALIWWLLRRRPVAVAPKTSSSQRGYDSAELAAGMSKSGNTAASANAATATPETTAARMPGTQPHSPQESSESASAETSASDSSFATSTPASVEPSASAVDATAPELELEPDPPEPEPEAEPTTPTWHADEEPMQVTSDMQVSSNPPVAPVAGKPAMRDNLALAKAYIDLGDENAARGLLREVMNHPDPAARKEATRLLRDMD